MARFGVGGAQTVGTLIRPVARLAQRSDYPQLCARLRDLAGAGLTAEAIAAQRNTEGYRPPKQREQFGRRGVQELLRDLAVRAPRPQPQSRATRGHDFRYTCG